MADDSTNIKVISKQNAGFPDYLDFDKLRTEGIGYLGKLSGKIWTDHNVHDPGITILEVLCYALLDLGYRTNLPAEDIFTRNPADNPTHDDNFFTPAQIFACNPLTIIDYRKLLIDIEGITNAWLEVATDQRDLCQVIQIDKEGKPIVANCETLLNGLYHVYLELEKNSTDFSEQKCWQIYQDDLTDKVKKALMAHRNLCEDFVDIQLLCKLPLGVCADIELEIGADTEQVYLAIVEKLRQFFSNSPQFYTLQQLLDKNKPIETIFAGRPYDITESHGFVDTDELVELTLKKEIHLSDVYNVIFEVAGVRRIKNLGLIGDCKNSQDVDRNWKFPLPKNHIPDFSVECSGFQFSRNGLSLAFDTKKYDALLGINFTHNGKILYSSFPLSPSPYLDSDIPKGVYRKELSDYLPLQNDFPRVYGIAEGGLSDSASVARKAQAMQLKGYLLFFDQLLANYLTQLTNVRSLFALSSPTDVRQQHTYFLNQLKATTDLQKLLRFPIHGNEQNTAGTILLYPVSKTDLTEIITQNPQKFIDPETFTPFTFASFDEERIAVSQLKNDWTSKEVSFVDENITNNHLVSDKIICGFLNKNSSCIYYYLTTTADEFVLMSKQAFPTIAAATQQLDTVKYVAMIDDNYHSFFTADDKVSFNIELNTASFTDYLQRIIEGRELYAQRRNEFLDHLLARFAERFTDFALFSYKKYASDQEAALAMIQAKENFLVNYADSSSNRGKGYDYQQNSWNDGNISGFEKEVKFLTGIENKQAHSLCNFVVEQYDDQYIIKINLAGNEFLSLDEKFDSRPEALEVAQEAFMALKDCFNLTTKFIEYERLYGVQLQYKGKNYALATEKYPTVQEANQVKDNLCRMFEDKPRQQDVAISDYRYSLSLLDNANKMSLTWDELFTTDTEALAMQKSLVSKFNKQKDAKRKLVPTQKNMGLLKYVDIEGFKIDINNTIVGKPDKFTYDLLDKTNAFKFYPTKEFDIRKDAEKHGEEVIALATDAANYQVSQNPENNKYSIAITQNGVAEAICYAEFVHENKAKQVQTQIYQLVKQHVYHTKIDKIPYRWKFRYYLGYDLSDNYAFISQNEFPSFEEALNAATAFRQVVPLLALQTTDAVLALILPTPNEAISTVVFKQDSPETEQPPLERIQQTLLQQQFVTNLLNNKTPEAFADFVKPDEISQTGKFFYRLVDKDNPLAYYSEAFAANQAEDAQRKVAKQLKQTVDYLEICLGGDIVVTEEDKKTIEISYHYKLIARHDFYKTGDYQGEPIVFFESTQGYTSKELAEAAFTENYLLVLHQASIEANYGSLISLQANLSKYSEALVFVPAETLAEFGNDYKKIAERIQQYPIQLVEKDSPAFAKLFCQDVPPKIPNKGCENNSPVQYVYYFTLQQENQSWQSVKYYETADEARQDFLFFLMLLKYSGNLYAACYDCSENPDLAYRIYIREVLAESANRFLTTEDAWGKAGIEKFICSVQATHSFQNKQNKDCNYSFYLTCGADLLIHPCQYDTAQQRNKALNELYNQFIKQPTAEIVRSEDETKYCIEIKLPNFTTNAEDENLVPPCGCEEKVPANEPICELAWQSACCYTNEDDAKTARDSALKLLVNYENYQPVFHCSCNSFGINLFSGNILAFNPQSYVTPEAVCQAVERTKKLTNAEGLHLVEHILLRPHTTDDCSCHQDLICHNNQCFYPWKVPDTDPCSQEQDSCFMPGADPYSFIATVALPAWTGRFRSVESKKLLENVLYQNAPAHVLLRILWLAPHDLCCFERKFKDWHNLLAQKETCQSNFSVCDFLDFLFHRQFECLEDCQDCQPCKNDIATPIKPYFENDPNQPDDDKKFINQINKLFCWKSMDCKEYEFIECEKSQNFYNKTNMEVTQTTEITPTVIATEETPSVKSVKVEVDENFTKKLPQFLNQRRAAYQHLVATAQTDNPIVAKVQRFLEAPNLSPQKIQEMVTEVLENKQPEGENATALDKNQAYNLLQSILSYSLDKFGFNENASEKIGLLRKTFLSLNIADATAIYEYWNEPALKKYAPELDVDKIKSLLVGGN